MKIISYNIAKFSQKKVEHILAMDADLYVLPELANKDIVTLPEGYEMTWYGDDDVPDKGLGVSVRKVQQHSIGATTKKVLSSWTMLSATLFHRVL